MFRKVCATDLKQRNGRILRQGNKFTKVQIFNYLTEKTFDSYLMSIIVNKQKFIDQLMSGKAVGRSCSDLGETVLNYAEMQAFASMLYFSCHIVFISIPKIPIIAIIIN